MAFWTISIPCGIMVFSMVDSVLLAFTKIRWDNPRCAMDTMKTVFGTSTNRMWPHDMGPASSAVLEDPDITRGTPSPCIEELTTEQKQINKAFYHPFCCQRSHPLFCSRNSTVSRGVIPYLLTDLCLWLPRSWPHPNHSGCWTARDCPEPGSRDHR
jgi:hypothetical protein